MKDVLLTILVIVAIYVVLPPLVLILRDKILFKFPSREQVELLHQKFLERLSSPDFAAVEEHFGHALPQVIRSLYENTAELTRSDFEVVPPDGSTSWSIINYCPVDSEYLLNRWPGTEEHFAFAGDGFGNEYLVDLREDDPPVLFFDHETGEFEEVCDSFAEFMTWERCDRADDGFDASRRPISP
jgi:hypothetical protein